MYANCKIIACKCRKVTENGISGNIVLNDAGDRIKANYDLWSDKIKLRHRSIYLEA
jgi:hypothetical protein